MDRVYLNNLYDYYSELLNEKQRSYFEDYYFNDLSLSEIAANDGVSRNAVHKQIKMIEMKLDGYEKLLKLYSSSLELDKILADLDDDDLRRKIRDLYTK